jgi:ABC-type branched-subunit amino acid transport system ATPase component
MTKVLCSCPISRGGQAKGKSSADDRLERANQSPSGDSTQRRTCFRGLAARRDAMPQDLTQVDLRKLDLAGAMIAKPQLLFVDEVMAGLSHSEVDEILAVLMRTNENAVAIVMIEHIMRAVTAFSQRLVVLVAGRKLADGNPQQVLANVEFRGPTLENSLVISGLLAGYGRVLALHDVSLTVEAGETVALLGTNGNGKSSLMKCVMGLLRPSAGALSRGSEMTRLISWDLRPRRLLRSEDPRPGRASPSSEADHRGESLPRRTASSGVPSHPSQPSSEL